MGCVDSAGEILSLLRSDLIPPAPGISKHWTCVARPSKRDTRTKAQTTNDIVRSASLLLSWPGPVLRGLHQGNPAHRVSSITPGEYLTAFQKKKKLRRCTSPTVVPYHARHSGASIDRADGYRGSDEVRQRGLVAKAQVRNALAKSTDECTVHLPSVACDQGDSPAHSAREGWVMATVSSLVAL